MGIHTGGIHTGSNKGMAFSALMSQQLTQQASIAMLGLSASDPFAKIAKAISGGFGKFTPTSSDMLGMVTKKQYKVPKGTTITIPRPNATLPVDRRDVAAGQMIITNKVAVYEEEELMPNDLFERTYVFKLPFNNKEIPYILVDHKRTTVIYIIELPGDLNEEIF